MPIIKRYPNRKLYDTEAKRYVTLEAITQMIHEGQEVQVVDHETGEDLTNLTLSQIIFEQEKKGAGLLPRVLLTNLVRAGGDTLDQMRRTLLRAGASETDAKAEAAENHAQNHAENRAESSPLHKVDELFQDLLAGLNVPTSRDLQRLQGQVDELNRRVAEMLAAEKAGNEQGNGEGPGSGPPGSEQGSTADQTPDKA